MPCLTVMCYTVLVGISERTVFFSEEKQRWNRSVGEGDRRRETRKSGVRRNCGWDVFYEGRIIKIKFKKSNQQDPS